MKIDCGRLLGMIAGLFSFTINFVIIELFGIYAIAHGMIEPRLCYMVGVLTGFAVSLVWFYFAFYRNTEKYIKVAFALVDSALELVAEVVRTKDKPPTSLPGDEWKEEDL